MVNLWVFLKIIFSECKQWNTDTDCYTVFLFLYNNIVLRLKRIFEPQKCFGEAGPIALKENINDSFKPVV